MSAKSMMFFFFEWSSKTCLTDDVMREILDIKACDVDENDIT